MSALRVGIDVGGTNTDAVLMRGGEVLAWAKVPTTPDVTSGIFSALQEVSAEAAGRVEAVMIGTTHFTNSVVQRTELAPVAILRLGAPATESLPPLVDWPRDLAGLVLGFSSILPGGHEFDGTELSPLDAGELRRAARLIEREGIIQIAISAVFSPINPDSELRAAEILREELPEADVTLSHRIGRMGLLERENATTLNAALLPLGRRIVDAFAEAVAQATSGARLYLTQNDGTLMSADFAAHFPVLTFASGPSNSMRGAAFLSDVTDALVVDVGGTSTDVGALIRGFPRPAPLGVEVGGVRTNFRMPDVVSAGLGGGSIVDAEPLRVGPRSVGYRITEEALVFGGETLTATDVAVALGRIVLGDVSSVHGTAEELYASAMKEIDGVIDSAVDRIRTHAEALPVVVVGGASFLVGATLTGASEIIRPPHASIANAVGAAMAQVSGEVDRVVELDGSPRATALDDCRAEAVRRAELAGALAGSVTIVDQEEVPLTYLPSNASRIRVKAVGDAGL